MVPKLKFKMKSNWPPSAPKTCVKTPFPQPRPTLPPKTRFHCLSALRTANTILLEVCWSYFSRKYKFQRRWWWQETQPSTPAALANCFHWEILEFQEICEVLDTNGQQSFYSGMKNEQFLQVSQLWLGEIWVFSVHRHWQMGFHGEMDHLTPCPAGRIPKALQPLLFP